MTITLATWGGLPVEVKRQTLEAALRETPHLYLPNFAPMIRSNLHVLDAVILEARKVKRRGLQRYAMRTIIEVLRHESALRQVGSDWKINNVAAPDLARLLMAMFPRELERFFQVRNGVARLGEAA